MMKKKFFIHRLCVFLLCLVLMHGIFPTSVSAAKEMFSTYEITSVSISGIDAPEAGKYFDFTAEENSQKYNILKVVWQQQYSDKYITDTSSVVSPGNSYSVCIILEVASPDHYFKTGEGRVSAVPSVTVNGQTAHADNAQDYELFSIDASKYEHDTTYQRFLRVWYTFPEVPETDRIESMEIVIDPPTAGELPAKKAVITTVNGGENVGYINVDDITWNYQDGRSLGNNTPFEYGENYTVVLYLSAVRSRKYAVDPTHFLASPGNPFPAVTATINGKTATVLPNGDAEKSIMVATVMACEKIAVSTETPFQPPKSEVQPDFSDDRISSVEKHSCSPMKVEKVEATCTEEGKKAHYFCPECGKFFEDAKCTKEITDINRWGVIPATGHSGGKATCAEKAKCKTCGAAYGDFAGHNYGTAWDYKDASGHAHKCKVCGGHDTVIAHTGGTADCGKKAKCSECKAEYGEAASHSWGTAWDYKDTSGHAHKCTKCGEHDSVQSHTGGTADCQNKAKCSACGTEYGKTGDHKWSTLWDYQSVTGHAHLCTVSGCDAHSDVAEHTPGAAATETSSQNCTVCGYIIVPHTQHIHKMIHVNDVDATCTEEGKKDYYYCLACNIITSDRKASKEITDESSLIIPPTGHKESKWKSDAELHWKECTVKGCGVIIEGTKLEHDFGKNNKCTVCNYKRETETTEEISPTVPETEPSENPDKEQDTGDPSTNSTPNEPVENEDPIPEDTEEDTVSPEPVNNSIIWIVIAAVIGTLAVSVIILTVLLVTKSKK